MHKNKICQILVVPPCGAAVLGFIMSCNPMCNIQNLLNEYGNLGLKLSLGHEKVSFACIEVYHNLHAQETTFFFKETETCFTDSRAFALLCYIQWYHIRTHLKRINCYISFYSKTKTHKSSIYSVKNIFIDINDSHENLIILNILYNMQ